MLNVRKMQMNDLEWIASLEQEIFTDAWSVTGIAETFQQPHSLIVVAEEESKLLGYCILYCVLDEAEIARIGVSGRARKKGIGTKILQYCEKLCVDAGMQIMLLDVREQNEPARRFYEKHGFQIDGIRKNFYENPKENAVLMSKALAEEKH